MVSFLYSPRSGWLALGLALAAVLLMQCWAGITLRGLYADGAYYAEQLLLRHSFVIIEPSRWASQMLIQTPVVLAMALGADGPHAVALAFSLASNLMPVVLTLACLAVLPPSDRAFGLFPVLIFLAASMSAAFASVADGPTAAAYAWLLMLLILFGPLTRIRLGGILLLAFGALRLHEAMAFLGPILAIACLWRCRTTTGHASCFVLLLAALLIGIGCANAVHDVLYPRLVANRASFIADVVSLSWLMVGPGQFNVMAMTGLAGLLLLPAAIRRGRAMGASLLVVTALAVVALAAPPCPPCAFAARDNACLLTAPAMVLLLIMRWRGWRPPARSAALVAMLGLSIAAADGRATLGWISYTGAMRAALSAGHGIVPWQAAVARLPAPQRSALLRYAWPWTTPLMSVWLTQGPSIGTIIANPPGVKWQPFDPDTLRPVLERHDTAQTRGGIVALLGR